MSKKNLESLKSVFSRRVEEHANKTGLTVLESIMDLHEEFGIEVEDIRHAIHDHLYERLLAEARKNNLLKDKGGKTAIEGLTAAFT